MKISVITVCFNSETTILHTLRSVCEQDYNNIEHVIIDGKSSDNTMEIIAANRSNFSKVFSEEDEGIYDAMNKGVRLASGDVIAFLNADDYYKSSDVLSKVAKVMNAENLDALYGDVEFFRAYQRDIVLRRYNSGRFQAESIGWGWMPAHPALFVRRDLFEKFGLFRTDYRIAGDFEFVARVFKQPELRHRHLPESLVCMRMGGASTSGWRATLQINREMMRACLSNGISTNWLKLLLRYPLKAVEFFRSA